MAFRTHVSVSSDTVNLLAANEFVTDIVCGAVALFVGVTRKDFVDGNQVVALEFETHLPLVHVVLKDLVAQYREENPQLAHVYIHHRVGKVPLGEGNVVIAVSSGHRKATFRALEEIMERLKANAPIWKKEIFDNGASRWMQNTEFTAG